MTSIRKIPMRTIRTKAVIFDMDGVITHTMPYHFAAWKLVLNKVGIAVTHRQVYEREGQPGLSSLLEIFWEHGKALDEKLAKKILVEKERVFKTIIRQRFIPGARNFIKDLNRRKFPLALVTGTARHEARKILPKRLSQLFDVTVTGSDVVKGKPHPEPFLRALKGLKISARDAIVIENAPCGILAAKAAKIRCLALETSLPKAYLAKADRIFRSFKDLNQSVRLVRSKT